MRTGLGKKNWRGGFREFLFLFDKKGAGPVPIEDLERRRSLFLNKQNNIYPNSKINLVYQGVL